MSQDQIEVEGLCKFYRVNERAAGLGASVYSIFRRRYKTVEAVNDISFSLQAGEVVGFLGPNGAGKTTTLKVLSGLLHPNAGRAQVLGHAPWRREREFLRYISLVMGQRTQLLWDIPAMDSFLVNKAIYDIPDGQFHETLDELVALLDLEPLLKKQVRALSLGERMKCELAASLLHRPSILFLDEPTIGVDITMQGRLRAFIAEYNRRTGATVLLTSHYMADVTALCRRVLVIHHGKLLYDGALSSLADRLAPFKVIRLDLEPDQTPLDFSHFGEVLHEDDGKVTFRVPKSDTASVIAHLLAEVAVADLTVEDPPIEEVIDRIFQEAAV
ncbi:MAG: ATP-binding cassette domain-containing protein [Armatimonadetes bacterium]|nr:ATP-binding cassette domain-containing protein [Armatimonadota bacterium]